MDTLAIITTIVACFVVGSLAFCIFIEVRKHRRWKNYYKTREKHTEALFAELDKLIKEAKEGK